MLLLDLTLPTGAENVALDEALLEDAESRSGAQELLRVWEPRSPLVVVGRSSQPAVEVRLEECTRRNVPVIRRTSGGAAIVTGPGCLMYSVVLSLERHPELRGIDAAHRFVLARLSKAIKTMCESVTCCGTSDLGFLAEAAGPDEAISRGLATEKCGTRPLALRKFSGNSLRMKRRHLLYHGTLLYDFDLALIETLLAHPPREPAYRAGRRHSAFVANLPAAGAAIRRALIDAWQAADPLADWPQARTEQLVEEKYARDEWNLHGK